MSSLQTILTIEQHKRLLEELKNNTFTFLDEVIETHNSSAIIDFLIHNSMLSHDNVSHLMDRVPLSWFWDMLSIDSERVLTYWSILFVYSFRVNQDPNHPLLQRLSSVLKFGDFDFWLEREFDSMTKAEYFWNMIIYSGDESLIISCVDYLSKYKEERNRWYNYMISSFVYISTDTLFVASTYATLSKRVSFRKWLKEIFVYDKPHTWLRHTCEMQEATEVIEESRRYVIELILEQKLPTELIKYVILKYL